MRNMRYIKVLANLGMQYDRRPSATDRYYKLLKFAPSERDQHFYVDDRLPALPDTSLTGQIRMDFLKMDGVIKISIDTLDDTRAANRPPTVIRRFFYYEQLINPIKALVEAIEQEFGVWWTPSIVNELGNGKDRLYSVILMRDAVRFPDLIGCQPQPSQPASKNQVIMTPPPTPAITKKPAIQFKAATKQLTANTNLTKALPLLPLPHTPTPTKNLNNSIKILQRTFATPRTGSSSNEDLEEVPTLAINGASTPTPTRLSFHTSSQNTCENPNVCNTPWTPSPIRKLEPGLDDSYDDIFSQIDLDALPTPGTNVATKPNFVVTSSTNTSADSEMKQLGTNAVPIDTSDKPSNINDDSIDIVDSSSPEREDPQLPHGQKRLKIQSNNFPTQSRKRSKYFCLQLSSQLDRNRSDPSPISTTHQSLGDKAIQSKRSLTSHHRASTTNLSNSDVDDMATLIETNYRLNWAKRALSGDANINAQRDTATDDDDNPNESDDTITTKAIQRARDRSKLSAAIAADAARLKKVRHSILHERAEMVTIVDETIDDDDNKAMRRSFRLSNVSNSSDTSTIISSPITLRHDNRGEDNSDASSNPDDVNTNQFLANLQSETPQQMKSQPMAPVRRQTIQSNAPNIANTQSQTLTTRPTTQRLNQTNTPTLESHYMIDIVKQHLVDQQLKNSPSKEPYEANGVRRYVINYTHPSWRFIRPRAIDRKDPQLLMRRRIGTSNQYNYYAVTNNMQMFQQAQKTENGAVLMKIPGDTETLHFLRIISFDKLCDNVYKQWIAAAKQERLNDKHNAASQRFYVTIHCDPIIEFMLDPIDIGNHAKIMNAIHLRYNDVRPLNTGGHEEGPSNASRRKLALPQQLINLEHSQFSETISREDAGLFAARETFMRQHSQEQYDQVMAATSLVALSGNTGSSVSPPEALLPQHTAPRRPVRSLPDLPSVPQPSTSYGRTPNLHHHTQQRSASTTPNIEQQDQQWHFSSQPPTTRRDGPRSK